MKNWFTENVLVLTPAAVGWQKQNQASKPILIHFQKQNLCRIWIVKKNQYF